MEGIEQGEFINKQKAAELFRIYFNEDIFDIAGDRINPGCIIVFDEYINYPSWEQHEFKAFQEFIGSRGDLSYRYTKLCSIGATYNPGSVCVEITTEN